ncbi:MAG: aldehyde dehydrogenase family protein [Actinomycetes bacterium]
MADLTPALIDGEDVRAESVSEVRSPYDGSPVGAVPTCTTTDIDRAVAVALRRHRSGPLHQFERAEVLDQAAMLLAARTEEFAQSISAESAKPIATARIEATRGVDTLRFAAAVARTLVGEVVALDASAAGAGRTGFTLKVPVGVVAAVSPFNFPLNLVLHKIAPAVAAGCPVVLKPASSTPLTALRIARLFEEAGLPPGWLNVVTCPGSVAQHLVDHSDVAMVTFTGSPAVGWGIRASAATKKVSLELGNNGPVVVTPDGDLELAAQKIVAGGYGFAGQTCISVQRVYAHRSIHQEFLGLLAAGVDSLVVGDPADPATQVSALISRGETDRVADWVDEAVGQGATVAAGGGRAQHDVLRPVLLDGVTPDMKVCRDEVFGPMVGVAAYDELDEAIELCNDSRYGLQAGVFTSRTDTALEAARRLEYGGVLINDAPTWRADQQPYGGVKDSGNTREGPAYTVEEMTERRMVVLG